MEQHTTQGDPGDRRPSLTRLRHVLVRTGWMSPAEGPVLCRRLVLDERRGGQHVLRAARLAHTDERAAAWLARRVCSARAALARTQEEIGPRKATGDLFARR